MHAAAGRPDAGGACAGNGTDPPGGQSPRLTTQEVFVPVTARIAREVANYLEILFGPCATIAGGRFTMS